MSQSEQINELAKALSAAQAEITGAKMDSKNPFFKTDYADLSSVWNACRVPLSKNGLAIMQTLDETEGRTVLITTLAHSSGQWIKSRLPLVINKNDPQAVGAAITYARRYALSSLVGVCPVDDDAESAMDLNEGEKRNLMRNFDKEPQLLEKFREKLNKWDLTTISRAEYVKTMEFFSKRKHNKSTQEGEVNERATVA